jgi:hypothetical protein
MKKILIISLVTILLMVTDKTFSQGFVAAIEDEGLSTLYGNACILKLKSGEEITGKFVGGVYIKDGLSKIAIKLENGEKAKFVPEQVISLKIKASKLMKLFMVSEASSSIKEMFHSDFNEIVNRDYIIFETALTAKKTDTYRLLQLINPGFDSKIKVFAEPSAKTGGLSVGGVQLTGGQDRAYLFVKGGDKAIMVKKGSYSKNFEELYADCPQMVSAFQGEKIKWDDVALHVFTYDQLCK